MVNDDMDAVSGTFATLGQDALVGTFGGIDLKISYTGDSGTSALSGGNDIVLYAEAGGGGTPYENWAGGAEFDEDDNGDGVPNGLAFLLGAGGPNDNALGLLPDVEEDGSGNLVLSFTCLDDASRGNATLYVEHSGDLGIGDPWESSVAVDDDGNVLANGVTLNVAENAGDADLNDVEAVIDDSGAVGGKLFGRLRAENP